MLASTIPIFLIIALGVWIKRSPHPPEGLFPALEWFSFYVAFPALLFLNTAQLTIDASALESLTLLVTLPMAAVLLLCLLGLRIARQFPDPARSSVIQGATRPSTYFGLAVAGLVFTDHIAGLIMLTLAIALPLVNVVAVVALSWWSGKKVTARSVLRNLVRNPIIVATVAGALYNATDLPIWTPLATALGILGNVALGLGLLCVGGGLVFRLEGARPVAILVTNTMKLMVLPALTWLLCQLLNVEPSTTIAACFYASLPTAPNAYIMARQMGGDARLMATLITTQTLLTIISLPLWMMWLGVDFTR
ncbi:AEC family transporter [Lampropedia aestuarii]|uniref:AEC family transporter n=1 Tax=Lampropedia aestuarii TaxID=2562762 RepID=A0A4S5BMF7_9BURK|nr:AEC family transporter [Lampropedia aestuarii]MDH5858393.1 AEC family transporter [Lampropedia aestuarii]THJ32011.1 AEC family transporter [Lampropedia aestuarii]